MNLRQENTKPKYPGKRETTNGNLLVSSTEALISEAGVFYPITPSTEMGENFQNHFAKGDLNAFGENLMAIETEGEHAAQGGAIAMSVTGKRTVNFTSGQGVLYGLEQYYHAPGKLSTMVLQVGARALTKHALNVHCGHDDVYATLDTGWTTLFAKDAQQAADQAIILRKVNEITLNPGINVQDGFLTTHLERTFLKPEAALIREFLGAPDEEIDTPTAPQRELFGPKRRRVPQTIDLKNPVVLGPVQNQEHYMNGIAARRNNFAEFILENLEKAYEEYGQLTGRHYGLISEYRCEDAETVFVALGSAAENIEQMVDYLREHEDAKVGVIHVNVLRPFPEKAIIEALKGRKNLIILERTDEQLSGDNPLTRDIRSALGKAEANFKELSFEGLPAINPATEMPHIFSGVYGLGSRDFRPEHIIGAYYYSKGLVSRQDGKKASDGVSFFYLGIDHPYAVTSEVNTSGLPKGSIAVRFHSIGGWGMITTGKNLGMILGEFSNYIAERDGLKEEDGSPKEVIHISANPKYGSEKKGAPTNYFLVAAPERIRVNCDLRHVDVVLCPDPKIFLHTNALDGLRPGGSFVWESSETDPAAVWERIPVDYRKEIIDNKIKLYTLPGFDIAKNATSREELQTRMQGNAFLGSFFGISSFLKDNNIPDEEFLNTVHKQYEKKFGRLGAGVVASNMDVMRAGFEQTMEIPYGALDAPDRSNFVGEIIAPCVMDVTEEMLYEEAEKAPMFKMSTFDKEFRSGLGYHQPSSVLSSVGMVAAATGATASKYVARREVPRLIMENCTQCMDCITVCPDTALPNTAQDIGTVIGTAARHYITDENDQNAVLSRLDDLESAVRAEMIVHSNIKGDDLLFTDIILKNVVELGILGKDSVGYDQLSRIITTLPFSYHKVKTIFGVKEKREPGEGGVFGIFVNDLCKGCAACVEACGHDALKMIKETEDVHAEYQTSMQFLDLLSNTPRKYLGLFDPESPENSKAAALQNHMMVKSKYDGLLSGDGACAGCGEKSVLHSVSSITETMMRPLYHKKADRFNAKADQLEEVGLDALEELQERDEAAYHAFRRSVLHIIMGLGAENIHATDAIIAEEFDGDDQDIINALVVVLRQEAFNHKHLQAIEGRFPNGMTAMAMTANTGCNTVYGSTAPNNPHPYPWMNSLFQDGATIGWLIGESFIYDHARKSVIPERLTDLVLSDFKNGFSDKDYFYFTHFSDYNMTDQEALELPKVWAIGGDGGMGDIGYQNVSKAVLQNRPNVKILLLDTQVYSNTGGQNSDSSVMTGGFDMNQFGAASQGKQTERKSVAESFLGGHGSPFVAQVSMANSSTLFKALLDGLYYRGTAFFQTFTACQPEHGIPDYASQTQALRMRDSRGMAEFVFNPTAGERYEEILNIKTNQNYNKDWAEKIAPVTRKKYTYTVAHWAFTEARFRYHHKRAKAEDVEGMIRLEDKIRFVTMNDLVHRYHMDPNHRAFIPEFGVYTVTYDGEGNEVYHILSRQMVAFVVERRKAWRLLQSKVGIENQDYIQQKELLNRMEKEGLTVEDILTEEQASLN
jgi:pyruvate-ferredoxin/flavodoxin oxidoreductase